MTLRITICDDDPGQIEYLTSLVSFWRTKNGHTCTMNSFPSAEAFLFDYAEDKSCDILLLDIQMQEEKTGIDIIPEIKSISPETKIIMITSFDDSEYIFNAFANGADNYVSKTESVDYIVKTIIGSHGEDIAVSSRDGVTDFVFSLTLKK